MHCKVSCHCWLHWSFSILPILKSNPRYCTRTHGEQCWQDPGNAEIPHTQRGLASLLVFQLTAVCQANLSFASVGLGKTVKCCPLTRKWDSSFARERKKKSRLRKSLVVCTNISLKYSVLNVQQKSKEEHCCILQCSPYREIYFHQLKFASACLFLLLLFGDVQKWVETFRSIHDLLCCILSHIISSSVFCWVETPAKDRICSAELTGSGWARCPCWLRGCCIPRTDSSRIVQCPTLGAQLAAMASSAGQWLHILPGDQHLRLPECWEAQPLKLGSVINFFKSVFGVGSKNLKHRLFYRNMAMVNKKSQ